MADAAENKIHAAVSQVMEDFDKSHLRKMQGALHRCAAKCCDNLSLSISAAQKCVETCSLPLQNVQKYAESQMTNLQDRLNRCAMQCQDQIKDKMGPNSKPAEMTQYQTQMEGCIHKCVDDHIELLPNMLKKCREMADKTMSSNPI